MSQQQQEASNFYNKFLLLFIVILACILANYYTNGVYTGMSWREKEKLYEVEKSKKQKGTSSVESGPFYFVRREGFEPS
jgi:hypothetical protein